MLGIISVRPLVVERIEGGGAVAVPAVTVAALTSDLLKPAARQTVTIAHVRLVVMQVVEACPYRLGGRVLHKAGVTIRAGAGPHDAQAGELECVKPFHRAVYGFLHPAVGIRQLHQQAHQRGAFLGAE